MHSDLENILEQLVHKYALVGGELIAMKTLAAFILVEISACKPDPSAYLLEVSARLTGLADLTARKNRQDAACAINSSAGITATFERVSTIVDSIAATRRVQR